MVACMCGNSASALRRGRLELPLKKVTELRKRLFQSEAECEAIDMKKSLLVYSHANKTLAWDQAPQWGKKGKKNRRAIAWGGEMPHKFFCLIKEMLFIYKLKPSLIVQTDSVRAKVFE